jgi:ferredoxin
VKKSIKRRKFLKAGAAAGTLAGATGMGFFGYESARDETVYTGWVDAQGSGQFFDRLKYQVDNPHYRKTGNPSRIDARTEVVYNRFYAFMRQWDDKKKLESLQPPIKEYYETYPTCLETDLELRNEIYPKRIRDREKYGKRFILSRAWSRAMASVKPPSIEHPPQISDFPGGKRFGEPANPYKMKNISLTTKLIKRISHEMGATLVGITRLNHDWVYGYPLKERGFDNNEEIEVPGHWQNAIVIGCPMSWDPLRANPNYGTSSDGDSRIRIAAFRIASFIRQLGYAARPHCPENDSDLILPPLAIDAGLGEQGRHSVLVTPELGANVSLASITTNLPLKPDKPIDFGLQDFCQRCGRCADQCPAGAISRGGREEIHGYARYRIDGEKCHNFWYSNLGNIGCRICVAVCPFTRKSNWLQRGFVQASARDPLGAGRGILSVFQKLLYPVKEPKSYFISEMGGQNASFREPPWWLRTENFIEEI